MTPPVIPANAGISCRERPRLPHEAPASAGVTIGAFRGGDPG